MSVTVDIEGQQVIISDVATEATLQKLVDKMGGANSPFGKETARAGQEFVKTQKEGAKANTVVRKELSGLGRQAGDTASELDKAAAASRGLAGKFGGLFSKVTDGLTTMVKFGAEVQKEGMSLQRLGTGFESLSNALPGFGAILGAGGGAIVAHTANLIDTFQGLSTTGAMFTENLFELEEVARKSHLRLDEMVGVIRENSESLAVFGGSAKLGAKRFAELSVNLQNTYRNDLRLLGMGAKESADMLASFIAVNARNAHFSTMSTNQQTAAAAGFAKEMTLMASLTGQDRKQLADKLANDRRRADVELKMSRMDPAQARIAKQAFAIVAKEYGENSDAMEALRAQFVGQSVVAGNTVANMILSGNQPIGGAFAKIVENLNSGNASLNVVTEELTKGAAKQKDFNKDVEAIAPFSEIPMKLAELGASSITGFQRNNKIMNDYGGSFEKFIAANEVNLDKTGKQIIGLANKTEDLGKNVRGIMNTGTEFAMGKIASIVDALDKGLTKAISDPEYAKKLGETTTNVAALGTSALNAAKGLDALKGKLGTGSSSSGGSSTGMSLKDGAKNLLSKSADKILSAGSKLLKIVAPVGAVVDGSMAAMEKHAAGGTTGEVATDFALTAGGSLAGGMAASAGAAKLLSPLLALGPPGMLAYGAGVLASGFGGSMLGSFLGRSDNREGLGDTLKGMVLGRKFKGDPNAVPAGMQYGGVIRQPTLAMLGEGRADEVVANLGPNGTIGVSGAASSSEIKLVRDAISSLSNEMKANTAVAMDILQAHRTGNRISYDIKSNTV